MRRYLKRTSTRRAAQYQKTKRDAISSPYAHQDVSENPSLRSRQMGQRGMLRMQPADRVRADHYWWGGLGVWGGGEATPAPREGESTPLPDAEPKAGCLIQKYEVHDAILTGCAWMHFSGVAWGNSEMGQYISISP